MDFLLVGGLDGDGLDERFVGIDGFLDEGVAGGLQARFVDDTIFRIGAARGGERVDDAIDGAHGSFDLGDGLLFYFIGEGVAIDAAGIEALGFSGGFEGGGVIPSGAAGLAVGGWLFEEDAEGIRAAGEGGDDAGGEAVAGGGADDENVLGRVLQFRCSLGDGDLFLDVLGAAIGVGGGADETSDFWGRSLWETLAKTVPGVNKEKSLVQMKRCSDFYWGDDHCGRHWRRRLPYGVKFLGSVLGRSFARRGAHARAIRGKAR